MMKQGKGAVLITGASSGIGKASALLLDRSGYRVFAGVRREQIAESLKAEASELMTPVILDIAEPEQIAGAVDTVRESLRDDVQLAALVNNAGVAVVGPLEFLPIEELRRQFEVNVIGHIAITQAVIPLLLKGKGRVVNISSAAAYFALPFLGGYCSSKTALDAITDVLRRELLIRGISVTTVAPGFTETPIWEKGYDQMDKLMDDLPGLAQDLYGKAYQAGRKFFERGHKTAVAPEKVAKRVLRAVESRHPKTRYTVGFDTYLLALAGNFLPDRLGDWITQKVLKN
jgi:NAD(P)-dependent dehydrogenase (short-subunit alcohol dehydrogenase family)